MKWDTPSTIKFVPSFPLKEEPESALGPLEGTAGSSAHVWVPGSPWWVPVGGGNTWSFQTSLEMVPGRCLGVAMGSPKFCRLGGSSGYFQHHRTGEPPVESPRPGRWPFIEIWPSVWAQDPPLGMSLREAVKKPSRGLPCLGGGVPALPSPFLGDSEVPRFWKWGTSQE